MTEEGILRQVRWPSPRAVAVAKHTLECDEQTAVDALVDERVLISRVRRECGLSLEDAAVAVTRASGLAGQVMARHGFTREVAIIELIRWGG